jgi:hypothetical protein
MQGRDDIASFLAGFGGDDRYIVVAIMGLSQEDARSKVGFLLDAFDYGPPAARRHRLRLGPDLRAVRRQRLDPRRDRVPEIRRRGRPR